MVRYKLNNEEWYNPKKGDLASANTIDTEDSRAQTWENQEENEIWEFQRLNPLEAILTISQVNNDHKKVIYLIDYSPDVENFGTIHLRSSPNGHAATCHINGENIMEGTYPLGPHDLDDIIYKIKTNRPRFDPEFQEVTERSRLGLLADYLPQFRQRLEK